MSTGRTTYSRNALANLNGELIRTSSFPIAIVAFLFLCVLFYPTVSACLLLHISTHSYIASLMPNCHIHHVSFGLCILSFEPRFYRLYLVGHSIHT